MSYGLFTFVSSLLFFVKSGHSFFVGMLLNGVQNRLHKTVLFKVGSFTPYFPRGGRYSMDRHGSYLFPI